MVVSEPQLRRLEEVKIGEDTLDEFYVGRSQRVVP